MIVKPLFFALFFITCVWAQSINWTAENIQISTAANLAAFREQVNGGRDFAFQTITLTADINLSGNWTPIGTNANQFHGVFNGDNRSITGLNVSGATSDNRGLFGFIGAFATVKNLKLQNVNVSGRNIVGALTGVNNGIVENIDVSGSVLGTGEVGALAGQNFGIIRESLVNGQVSGTNQIGGFVGSNFGLIENADADATVPNTAGRIVGFNSGRIIEANVHEDDCGKSVKTAGTNHGVLKYNVIRPEGCGNNDDILQRLVNADNEAWLLRYAYLDVEPNSGFILREDGTAAKVSYDFGGVLGQEGFWVIDEEGFWSVNGDVLTVLDELITFFLSADNNTIADINTIFNNATAGILYERTSITLGGNVFIRPDREQNNRRYGIILENAVVSDKAQIRVITPEAAQINLRIFDALGNLVFASSGFSSGNSAEPTATWNLTNNAGRLVSSGAYLIIVEAKGVSGKTFTYSARIGVRR